MLRDVRCPACGSRLCRIGAPGTPVELKCTAKGGCRRIVQIDREGRAQIVCDAPKRVFARGA